MSTIKTLGCKAVTFYDTVMDKLKYTDFVVPLAFRLILAPVLIVAGYHKLQLPSLGEEGISFFQALMPDPNVVEWFGNSDWGLGMPFPELMTFMAGWTEFLGGWLLLFGLAARFVSIPLAGTMLVAALTAHLGNGWFAIAPSNPDTSAAQVYSWLGFDMANESLKNSEAVSTRLSAARGLLAEHGNNSWLTEKGSFVVLNNGIEFAITYLFMLLTVFFMGGGRFVSIDYWLNCWIRKQAEPE